MENEQSKLQCLENGDLLIKVGFSATHLVGGEESKNDWYPKDTAQSPLFKHAVSNPALKWVGLSDGSCCNVEASLLPLELFNYLRARHVISEELNVCDYGSISHASNLSPSHSFNEANTFYKGFENGESNPHFPSDFVFFPPLNFSDYNKQDNFDKGKPAFQMLQLIKMFRAAKKQKKVMQGWVVFPEYSLGMYGTATHSMQFAKFPWRMLSEFLVELHICRDVVLDKMGFQPMEGEKVSLSGFVGSFDPKCTYALTRGPMAYCTHRYLWCAYVRNINPEADRVTDLFHWTHSTNEITQVNLELGDEAENRQVFLLNVSENITAQNQMAKLMMGYNNPDYHTEAVLQETPQYKDWVWPNRLYKGVWFWSPSEEDMEAALGEMPANKSSPELPKGIDFVNIGHETEKLFLVEHFSRTKENKATAQDIIADLNVKVGSLFKEAIKFRYNTALVRLQCDPQDFANLIRNFFDFNLTGAQ